MTSKKKFKTATVVLNGVRPTWVSLDKADTTYNTDGVYGLGIAVTKEIADLLNPRLQWIAEEAGVPAQQYQPGDMLKVTMKAGGLNRKTNERWSEAPNIFTADLEKAEIADIRQIGRKSLLNVSVMLKPYDGQMGKGVSTRLWAVQIASLYADETGTDYGFAPAVNVGRNDQVEELVDYAAKHSTEVPF